MLHKNRLAEKLKQAKLELKEKKESHSHSNKHREVVNGRNVLVSNKIYNDEDGNEIATLLSE